MTSVALGEEQLLGGLDGDLSGQPRESNITNTRTFLSQSACLYLLLGAPVPSHNAILTGSLSEILQMASVMGRLPQKHSLTPDL